MPNDVNANPTQLFMAAVQHHQAGRLPQAEALYRQVLAIDPRHAGSIHSLGVLAHQVGRSDVAIDLIGQAIALAPQRADFHCNLGEIYRSTGQLDLAMASHRAALQIKPDFADALFNLGTVYITAGHPEEAIAPLRAALRVQPNYPQALNNLANALLALGQLDDAIATFRAALNLVSDYPEARNNLGKALIDKEQPAEAATHLRHALRLNPKFPDALNNLGTALNHLRQVPEALASYQQALAIDPNCADAHNNLGNVLQELGQLDEAIASIRRALQLKPNSPGNHYNLANALRAKGKLNDAIASYQEALRLKPDYADASNNLGNAFKDKGQLEEAISWYRRALAAKPNSPGEHGNILLTLNYVPDYDARTLFNEHRGWNDAHAQPLAHLAQPHRNDRSPERILRIGYVSPDFYSHSVAYFIEGLLASHDPQRVEVYCYADVARPDQVTARLRKRVPHWHDIHKVPDAQAAELVRGHGIDLLIDLAGHTAHNRLLLFARKPAPVQISWLGYSNTTGMSAMDYRLTDAFADLPSPTDVDPLYTETLVRLPDIFACYRPPQDAPPVNALPAQTKGYITFGSFHTLAKLNDPLFEHWTRILSEVPNSRLLMVAAGLNEPTCRERLAAFFGARGIAPERLDFRGNQPLGKYLAVHHEVDLTLDSYPFTGHTIACHALWMGVPVVTRAGESHRSRMVASVLRTTGIPELVAHTPEEYIDIATRLAGDLPRLAELRSSLRQRMQPTPLMDAPRFARNIEDAYRSIWRKWCQSAP